MNAPIFSGDQIVMLAGVGNKDEEYNKTDVQHLELLMQGLWSLIERKQTNEALKQSEGRFKTLVGNIPGAIFRCKMDRDWTMLFVSDKMKDISGYDPSELINSNKRTYNSLIHKDDQEMVYREVLKNIHNKESYQLKYRLIRKDGNSRWIHENASGVFDQNDNLLYIDGVIVDVTEQKQAELELMESEKMLNNFFHNHLLVFLHDVGRTNRME